MGKRNRREKAGRTQEAGLIVDRTLAAPLSLGEIGRAYWQRLVPLLVERGLLTVLHLEPLEALCDQWQRYQSLKAWLNVDPARWTLLTESGFEVESPQSKQLYAALQELQRLWAKFGLTPHGQARIVPKGANLEGAVDPAAGLMAAAEGKTRDDEAERPPRR